MRWSVRASISWSVCPFRTSSFRPMLTSRSPRRKPQATTRPSRRNRRICWIRSGEPSTNIEPPAGRRIAIWFAHGRGDRSRPPAGPAQADPDPGQEPLDKNVPRASQRDRNAAVLRGHARSPADPSGDRDTACVHDRFSHCRQEAGLCPCAARRADLCRRDARPRSGCAGGAYRAYREPKTLVAVEYYFKTPSDLAERLVIVVVPILATANTAVAAVDRLKERGAKDIRLVCLISAPQGIERMRGIHPDVPIWTAAIDEALDEQAFIVPGLGDAGDRAYGTK